MRFSAVAAIVVCVVFAAGCSAGKVKSASVSTPKPLPQLSGDGRYEFNRALNRQVEIKGWKPSKAETRKVDTFTSVAISSTIEADIKIGSPASVVIEANPDYLKRISTSVRSGTLTVQLDGTVNTRLAIKAHIVTPNLNGITVEGASSAGTLGLRGDIVVIVSGASRLNLNGKFGTLKVQLDGDSHLSASGSARVCDLTAGGGSTATLEPLDVGAARANCSGASTVSFGSLQQIDFVAKGASSINYTGSPKVVRSDADGASSISSPD